jgi:hypothetical protein
MNTRPTLTPASTAQRLALAGLLLLPTLASPAAETRPYSRPAPFAQPAVHPTSPTVPTGRPLVQLALLLDTSNSMDGLIAQAKSQLWKIVNEFNEARRDGQPPVVQVALYEYGNTRLSATKGYVRQILAFTTDLDRVSEELFRLSTNGGDEYCGWVIRDAVRDLQWSRAGNDYKAVFIAGNEPFTQGPVSYVDACRSAIGHGIVVNTIHCGPEEQGRQGSWKDGAQLAEGRFMTINQDAAVAHVAAPQDDRIAALGVELNRTYLAYGDAKAAEASKSRQAAQDAGALSQKSAGSSVQRALTKASRNYDNGSWDLVDASRAGTVKLEQIPDDQLPAELRGKSLEAKQEFVRTKALERAQLQKQIEDLNRERTRWLAEQRPTSPAAVTLDRAITDAVRSQATQRNFNFVATP